MLWAKIKCLCFSLFDFQLYYQMTRAAEKKRKNKFKTNEFVNIKRLSMA